VLNRPLDFELVDLQVVQLLVEAQLQLSYYFLQPSVLLDSLLVAQWVLLELQLVDLAQMVAAIGRQPARKQVRFSPRLVQSVVLEYQDSVALLAS